MSILDRIATAKRDEVERRRAMTPLADIERAALRVPPPRGFRAALQRASADGIGLIAEIKRASPSKGIIRKSFEPSILARQLEDGGASCLSILTDEADFGGSADHLRAASAASRLPCLRKDFLVDSYQVAESRAMGADCILVILAMITDECAGELMATAAAYHMDVIVEIHDEQEAARAIALGATMIGINNRDLRSFVTNLATTGRLAPLLPGHVLPIAESGIGDGKDVATLLAQDVRSFLVGESVMRHPCPADAVRDLLSAGYGGRATRSEEIDQQ